MNKKNVQNLKIADDFAVVPVILPITDASSLTFDEIIAGTSDEPAETV